MQVGPAPAQAGVDRLVLGAGRATAARQLALSIAARSSRPPSRSRTTWRMQLHVRARVAPVAAGQALGRGEAVPLLPHPQGRRLDAGLRRHLPDREVGTLTPRRPAPPGPSAGRAARGSWRCPSGTPAAVGDLAGGQALAEREQHGLALVAGQAVERAAASGARRRGGSPARRRPRAVSDSRGPLGLGAVHGGLARRCGCATGRARGCGPSSSGSSPSEPRRGVEGASGLRHRCMNTSCTTSSAAAGSRSTRLAAVSMAPRGAPVGTVELLGVAEVLGREVSSHSC